MAKLSPKEQKMLQALQDKSEAPDSPSVGKSVNVNVDLSDPKQVAMAQKFGLLDGFEEEDDDDDSDDDDDDKDEAPKRRGYF